VIVAVSAFCSPLDPWDMTAIDSQSVPRLLLSTSNYENKATAKQYLQMKLGMKRKEREKLEAISKRIE
jgi:hypothetical protein